MAVKPNELDKRAQEQREYVSSAISALANEIEKYMDTPGILQTRSGEDYYCEIESPNDLHRELINLSYSQHHELTRALSKKYSDWHSVAIYREEKTKGLFKPKVIGVSFLVFLTRNEPEFMHAHGV